MNYPSISNVRFSFVWEFELNAFQTFCSRIGESRLVFPTKIKRQHFFSEFPREFLLYRTNKFTGSFHFILTKIRFVKIRAEAYSHWLAGGWSCCNGWCWGKNGPDNGSCWSCSGCCDGCWFVIPTRSAKLLNIEPIELFSVPFLYLKPIALQ